MSPLVIIQLIAVALPLLTQLILFVEDQVKQAQANGVITDATGANKKTAVLTLFGQLWSTLATSGAGSKVLQLPTDQMSNLLSQLIDGVVGTFNVLGIFTKSTPAILSPVV